MKKIYYFYISTLCISLLFLNIPSYANSSNSAVEDAYNGFYSYIAEDYKSAIEFFSKAIELEPNDFIYYHQRGQAYYKLKKYKKALCDFNKVIELNPEYAEAYLNRRLVKLKLKDFKGAKKDTEFILKNAPNYVNAIKHNSKNKNMKKEKNA